MSDFLYILGKGRREGLRELNRDSFEFVADGEGNEYTRLPFNDFDKNHCDVTQISSQMRLTSA